MVVISVTIMREGSLSSFPSASSADVYFLTVDIGFFVLDDDDKVVPAQFAAHAFRDERIIDFAAVRFDGMEFLFVGRTEFPVFNGVMVHPALFGYVPQVGDGFAD